MWLEFFPNKKLSLAVLSPEKSITKRLLKESCAYYINEPAIRLPVRQTGDCRSNN